MQNTSGIYIHQNISQHFVFFIIYILNIFLYVRNFINLYISFQLQVIVKEINFNFLYVCRSYYRCTHMYDQHCEAMKHVQRTQENPPLYKTTYYGHHSCKSSFHSDITFESILSSDSDSNSILLNFDNNIPCKQEYSFWSPSSLPPLVSTKGEPMEVNQVIQDTDHLAQNQLVSSKNLLLCDFDVYFDYLRHATMLSSTETVELENVCSQFGF